CARDGEYFDVW
nr:immunoglobulin heavy chain junction region [Mus musculus]